MSAELEFKIMHMVATSKDGKISAYEILKVAFSFHDANETLLSMIENNQLSMFYDKLFIDKYAYDFKILLLSPLTDYTEYRKI